MKKKVVLPHEAERGVLEQEKKIFILCAKNYSGSNTSYCKNVWKLD